MHRRSFLLSAGAAVAGVSDWVPAAPRTAGFAPDLAEKFAAGLLDGIALGRGRVPPPEALLPAQFPHDADLFADQARAGLTVGNALSLQMDRRLRQWRGAALDEAVTVVSFSGAYNAPDAGVTP